MLTVHVLEFAVSLYRISMLIRATCPARSEYYSNHEYIVFMTALYILQAKIDDLNCQVAVCASSVGAASHHDRQHQTRGVSMDGV